MSGYSNVGNRGVYEAGDQRNISEAERKAQESDPYNEGKENSHNNLDSKDERSIANRLAAEEQKSESGDDTETAQLKKDPTLPARAHGNEPSKGAKVDGVYEAGDQRNVSEAERKAQESDPYNEGKENSHNNLDSKDERSIANRLAAEEKKSESGDDTETAQLKKDPTLPARAHGNEPSKGAKVDAQLQAEEEEELKRKGKA
jgi:hypothetical protein